MEKMENESLFHLRLWYFRHFGSKQTTFDAQDIGDIRHIGSYVFCKEVLLVLRFETTFPSGRLGFPSSWILNFLRTRPDTRHKMRLERVLFTFEKKTQDGQTDRQTDGWTDGRTRPHIKMRRRI